ncbi:MAG: hypothetical protein FD165_1929 [Gammaproteobacteria bacterium]|nr:MAG: hypothetical protein FD165_1929 [Gammaproteobacteria bacterium]TND04501.1 MAG: hypothetical protein FD120_1615 [Gammaproteobacteria bacterium]
MTERGIALVTGGAGFIGSHLVERLLMDGWKVRVLDNLSTGKLENLPSHGSLEFIHGDVGDYDTVVRASESVAWIFHQAAIASVPRTIDDPIGSHHTNYLGTLNVLEAAKYNCVSRVVFAASAAAYGDMSTPPLNEDMPANPLSPYAIDKLSSEYCCKVYFQLFGLEAVGLRYFNVFGPRQDPSSPYSGVISIFVDTLLRKEIPVIFGDGEQTRDFVYISDVIEANIKAAESRQAPGTVLNIGTGTGVTLNRLLRMLGEIMNTPVNANYKGSREGDIRDSWANITRAKEVLDWRPNINMEDGLIQLISYLKSRRPT